MKYMIVIVMLCFSLQSAQAPQKVQLSDDLLDRLNEIEEIYRGFLASGMTPQQAQRAACDWQDKRYPVILQMPKEHSEKKEKKVKK